MEFLVKVVGCELAEAASYPVLLTYSLDRRLVPRYEVMRELKKSGLLGMEYKLSSIVTYSSKVFERKFVNPYKDKVEGLHEMYASAATGGAREEVADDS